MKCIGTRCAMKCSGSNCAANCTLGMCYFVRQHGRLKIRVKGALLLNAAPSSPNTWTFEGTGFSCGQECTGPDAPGSACAGNCTGSVTPLARTLHTLLLSPRRGHANRMLNTCITLFRTSAYLYRHCPRHSNVTQCLLTPKFNSAQAFEATRLIIMIWCKYGDASLRVCLSNAWLFAPQDQLWKCMLRAVLRWWMRGRWLRGGVQGGEMCTQLQREKLRISLHFRILCGGDRSCQNKPAVSCPCDAASGMLLSWLKCPKTFELVCLRACC